MRSVLLEDFLTTPCEDDDFSDCANGNVEGCSFLTSVVLLPDLVFGGSLGDSDSGEKFKPPGSVELELLALAVLDLVSVLILESLSLLRAKEEELVLAVLPVLVLDVLFGTPPFPLDFSLELKNLNLSNIEFLFCGGIFCEVLLLEAVELVEVVLPVLTTLGCLSPVGRGVVSDRPPGVGIPDPGTAGEVALDEG